MSFFRESEGNDIEGQYGDKKQPACICDTSRLLIDSIFRMQRGWTVK